MGRASLTKRLIKYSAFLSEKYPSIARACREAENKIDYLDTLCDSLEKQIMQLRIAKLDWAWDSESDSLMAPSAFHDDGVTLPYAIHRRASDWEARLDGSSLATGTLAHCMAFCEAKTCNAATVAAWDRAEHG